MTLSFMLIALVIIAIIAGPIMMLRPSPSQKRKETMRTWAREKGIHFSQRRLPQSLAEAHTNELIPVYFFAPDQSQTEQGWTLVRSQFSHELHFMGSWEWQGAARATEAEQVVLRNYVVGLPESVKALSSGAQGICVYWTEQGGEAELRTLAVLLEDLKQAVTAKLL